MKRTTWILAGLLVLTVALLVVSCGGAATPAPSPTTTPATTTPATTAPATTTPATTTPVADDTPKIPHTLEGRADCIVCHQTGLTAPAVAASPSHASFTNATCLGCHQTGVGGAPAISEAHDSRTSTECLVCHADRITAPMFPSDHAPFTNATCQGCHQTQ